MNLIADEGLDRQIVYRLREDGHSVLYVAEMEPGISDDSVLDLANQESAILMTSDRDFGELVFRQRRLTQGIILIRLAGLSPSYKAELVSSAIKQHTSELHRSFSVITPGTIRIRRRSESVTPIGHKNGE